MGAVETRQYWQNPLRGVRGALGGPLFPLPLREGVGGGPDAPSPGVRFAHVRPLPQGEREYAPNAPRTPLRLFGGTLLIFLAFYGGDGGYLDVREYLDDAQRLWLKGDLRVSVDPPVYNRYALGLPIVAGPFVYAGWLLSWATGGAVSARGITALAVPVLGAAAVALFFCWSMSLGCGARAACWASLLFAFSSPVITYTQHFFTEELVLACSLLAIWSFAQAVRTGRSGCLLAAGAGLGFMPMAHNSSLPTTAALWSGMTVVLLLEQGPVGPRLRRVLLLTAVPVLAAGSMLYMNYSRYGSPFTSSYHAYYGAAAREFIRLAYIPRNLSVIGGWLLRTPWLAPALALTVWLCWRGRSPLTLPSPPRGEGKQSEWKLLLPVLAALAAQTFFWLCYRDLWITTYRYLLPLTGLWALGLPVAGQWLERRFPVRGLAYTLIVFLMIGAACFMRDDGVRPFHTSIFTGALHCSTWYMEPATRRFQVGSPCGWVQGLTLVALLAGGCILLARAWRLAGAHPEEQGG
ncbi:MAG: hypothetical protein ABSE73_10520 [Planctomycetota bacterium]